MYTDFVKFSKQFISDCKKGEPWIPFTGLRQYEVFLHKIGDYYVYDMDTAYTLEQALGDLTLFVQGKPQYKENTYATSVLIKYCKEFFYKLYLKQVKVLFYENKKEFLPIIKERLLELKNLR